MDSSERDLESLNLRRASEDDIELLLDLEEACFDDPWTREAFLQELVLPHAELWLLVSEGEVSRSSLAIAYVNFWVVAEEVSLLNVAVRPEYRRRGLGSKMMTWMEAQGQARGGESVFLEVRRSNDKGIALYEESGYAQVGIRKGYYSSDGEDALVMSKTLA